MKGDDGVCIRYEILIQQSGTAFQEKWAQVVSQQPQPPSTVRNPERCPAPPQSLVGHINPISFRWGKQTLDIFCNVKLSWLKHPGGPKTAFAFCRFSEKLAFHLSETLIEPPKNLQKRGLGFRVFCVSLRRNAPAFSFLTSLRSQRQSAAPHLAGARHSAADFTHKRTCGLHEGSEFKTYALQLDQIVYHASMADNLFAVINCILCARSAITKQSSGCAYRGQACAPSYNKAVERVLPW